MRKGFVNIQLRQCKFTYHYVTSRRSSFSLLIIYIIKDIDIIGKHKYFILETQEYI